MSLGATRVVEPEDLRARWVGVGGLLRGTLRSGVRRLAQLSLTNVGLPKLLRFLPQYETGRERTRAWSYWNKQPAPLNCWGSRTSTGPGAGTYHFKFDK